MSTVPRTFRRESRLFLWVALLLVLFLNLLTLLFFRRAVDWASESVERRAADLLQRLPLSAAASEDEAGVAFRKATLDRDVVYVAEYDGEGRRLRTVGPEIDAPETLPVPRPDPGRIVFTWRKSPTLLLATAGTPRGAISLALDPGPGAALRSLASALTVVVPVAGAALVVLAGFYLRSLLSPYDR
jgi:hypothetical protein